MTTLDAERERWSPADLPVADPDDLVPVADRCRVRSVVRSPVALATRT
jgi:hypothetical protein